ncbi:MAG: DUF4412 domain-containing protein, partial [Candidatus Binatia bacterium]
MAIQDRRAPLAALLALTAAACQRPATEGFQTVELVHRITGRQERETVSYGPDGVRFVRPDGTYILRYADRTIFILNEQEKTFAEEGLDAFVARQKEKDMQPDVPDLAGSVGAGSGVQIEETSQKTPIGGVDATLTKVRGERFEVELWLAHDLAPPGPRRPTFELLQALGGPLALPAVLFDHVKGFPVRSIVRVKGGLFGEIKATRALLSVDRTAPPAEAFAVPAD